MRRHLISASATLLLGLITAAAAASSNPNLIFILCDDLGYGDVKLLNPEGKIATPNFDRIGREGMTFTDAHTPSSVCTPTRYGAMTGRYNWRSKLQQGVLGGLSPRLIEPGRLTLASLLQAKGYRTAAVGKWHLGMDWKLHSGKTVAELNIESREQAFSADFTQPLSNGPRSVGFDHYFGIAASLDMVPYCFIRNERVVDLPSEDRDLAMNMDKPQARSRKGPASPGFRGEEVLDRFVNEAIALINKDNPKPFFLYLPLASPHTPILPKAQWQGKSGLNAYADFVMATDAGVGRLLKHLDETQLADNTLIIFTSDNGCSPQANYDELLAKGHNPSGPWRGHKADIYEGGQRVPFLVRWPARIKAGQRSSQLVCLTDILATTAEVLNHSLPANAAEDSYSFLPALTGAPPKGPQRSHLVSHSIGGHFAIREGAWKLALCPGSGGWSKPRPGEEPLGSPAVQLFDLNQDPGETNNLAPQQPAEVTRLTKLLQGLIDAGRSTPGPTQENAVPVQMIKPAKPVAKKKSRAKF